MRRASFNRCESGVIEMKKQLATLALLSCIGLAAHATGNNNGPVFGNVTNNSTTNNAGGAGGNAAASAVAGGGSASNRTEVSVDVRNTNVNSAAQHQGQTQGQQQAAIAGSSSGGNTLNTTVTSIESQRPVSSAIAPSMNPTANCAIPVTGGIAAASLAISGGSAYESDTCITIEQAKVADARGERDVAGEIMCGLDKYRAARKAVGKPCGADSKVSASPAEASVAASTEPTDPFIRRRLGLPAL